MKACALYIRVSDEKQTRGASLADQERACRAYAERAGLRVVVVYRDDGKSAWKDDIRHRPQFEQLLTAARLQRRRFGAVVVFKLDRFARRARVYHTCRWELERAGVQLLSATEPNETSAAGRLSSGMLAQFAEFYSDQLSERITGALHSKAARGEWVGPAPFGYEQRGRWLAPGPLALWVPLIFTYYTLGASTVDLAVALNAAGVPLRSGRPWTKDSVLMVLHNRAYVGYVGGRRIEQRRGVHQPLITDSLWEAAQERLQARRRRPQGKIARRAAPLTYEPLCAICGGSVHRITSGGRGYVRCRASQNAACKARGVRYERVEEQIVALRDAGTVIARVWIGKQGVERFE